MSTGGDAADQVVREGILIMESAVKMAGSGAKNVAAFALAAIKDGQKLNGKTTTRRLLALNEPLSIYQLKGTDLHSFHIYARDHGVLYTGAKAIKQDNGLIDILVPQRHANAMNLYFAQKGYPVPEGSKEEKKTNRAHQSKNNSTKQESGLTASNQETTTDKKPSVRGRMRAIIAEMERNKLNTPTKQKSKGSKDITK